MYCIIVSITDNDDVWIDAFDGNPYTCIITAIAAAASYYYIDDN